MSRSKDFKVAIAAATADKRGWVVDGYNEVLEVLNRIDRSRLDAGQSAEYQTIAETMQNTLAAFDTQNPGQSATAVAEAKQLKNLGLIRVLGFTVLLFVAFLMLFTGNTWWLCLVFAAIAFIGNAVFGSILGGKAQALAQASRTAADHAAGVFGRGETLDAPASGLVLRADNLWLSTLSEVERMTEYQRRQAEKQMAMQQRQHEAQMAAMQQQMEHQKAVLAETRAQNDALFGQQRGFIGQVMENRDRIKQDRKLQ